MALTFRAAFSALYSVRHKWFNIGMQLGISSFQLKIIETNSPGSKERLQAMLEYWMNNVVVPQPSWKVLVNSLKVPTVGESMLAKELEEEYCSPEDTSTLGEWEAVYAKC